MALYCRGPRWTTRPGERLGQPARVTFLPPVLLKPRGPTVSFIWGLYGVRRWENGIRKAPEGRVL